MTTAADTFAAFLDTLAETLDLGGDERVVAVVQYLRVVLVTASMPLVAAALYGASLAPRLLALHALNGVTVRSAVSVEGAGVEGDAVPVPAGSQDTARSSPRRSPMIRWASSRMGPRTS